MRTRTCILLLLATAGTAQAQDRIKRNAMRFYKGPVSVRSLAGRIELTPAGAPVVALEATLVTAAEAKTVEVSFFGGKRQKVNVTEKVSQKARLPADVKQSGKPRSGRDLKFNLMLALDGLPLGKRIDSVDIQVVLPAGVPALIRSSLKLEKGANEGGHVTYRLRRDSAYLTTLTLVYTTGPVVLSIDKRIQPAAITGAGPVEILLKITNLGREDAQNVVLEDSFDPRDFEGVGPGFKAYAGEANDRRLLWSQTVRSIARGQTVEVRYKLRSRLAVHGRTLNAVVATLGGGLVGVSNKIKLPKRKR